MVNHQIRDETHGILLHENLFVRVTSYSRILGRCEQILKPIVLAQNRQARNFKHSAMLVIFLTPSSTLLENVLDLSHVLGITYSLDMSGNSFPQVKEEF